LKNIIRRVFQIPKQPMFQKLLNLAMRTVRDHHIDLSIATFAIHLVVVVVSLIASWLASSLCHVNHNWKEHNTQLGLLLHFGSEFGFLAIVFTFLLLKIYETIELVNVSMFIEWNTLEIAGTIFGNMACGTVGVYEPIQENKNKRWSIKTKAMRCCGIYGLRTSLMTYWKFHLKFVYSLLPERHSRQSSAVPFPHTPTTVKKNRNQNWRTELKCVYVWGWQQQQTQPS